MTNIANSETDAVGLDRNNFDTEDNAKVEEIFVKDQVLTLKAGHTAIEPISKDPSVQVTSQNIVENDEDAVKVIPLGGHERNSRSLPSWLSTSGHFNKLFQDKESKKLEAFIIPATTEAPLKLLLGHEGLKKMKQKLSLSWDQYAALDYEHHKRINQTILHAKQHDSRERTCVAVGRFKGAEEEKLLAFFSLGAEPKPVYFEGVLGRKFWFPYRQCRTWDVSFPTRL